jgi:hypothetical protein
MELNHRRPGHSRWAILLTGVYAVTWPPALAFAIVEGQEVGWVVLSLATISAACSLTVAYGLPRRGRR